MKVVSLVLLLSGCAAPVVCPVVEPIVHAPVPLHRSIPPPLPLPPLPPSALDELRAVIAQ
jgi:hypothetical protein